MPRDRQRGNSLLLALIVMSALATLGSLTVVSVQSSLKASTNDRFQSVALYAAESGAAAAMVYLRGKHVAEGTFANTIGPNPPVAGNGVAAGDPSSLFTNDQNASFSVVMATSPADPSATDRVLIRATGYGAQGSTAIMEWDVGWDTTWYTGPPAQAATTTHGLVLHSWRVINL
ncbi:MAG TPA: hypothetical protein VGC42_00120 [Kofleriaceae bacterium]